MIILGIESSCDETAAAVVEEGRFLRGECLSSQADVHAEFGGVVPESASRQHMKRIWDVVEGALERAEIRKNGLDAVAVTQGPGLVGALLVGMSFGKGMALGLNVPLIAVNHLEGHLISWILGNDHPRFPHIALVVSGGHTELYRVESIGRYQILGRTRDDAAGEAFDKAARILGLNYPGGPAIDRLASGGDPSRYPLPRPMLGQQDYDFSFSGLKTAFRRVVDQEAGKFESRKEDLAASFQSAAVDVLVKKTLMAAHVFGIRDVVVTGGVAANTHLRRCMGERAAREGVRSLFPEIRQCTDNAGMIAAAAFFRWKSGWRDSPDTNANPSLLGGCVI